MIRQSETLKSGMQALNVLQGCNTATYYRFRNFGSNM
jgi:hypothetical protein